MSTTPVPYRHALGMPAGSIRALLALSVLASLWVMALVHPKVLPATFVYLTLLKLFILVHYYASHSKTMGLAVSTKHALGLPRGTVRIVLLGGFAGLLTYLWKEQIPIAMPEAQKMYLLIAVLLAGFFTGYVLTKVFRSSNGSLPSWYQDIQAWLALLAAVALMVLVIVYGVINPSVEDPEKQLTLDRVETGLAGLIGFYFGARS